MSYIGFRLGLSSELVKLAAVVGGFFVSFRYYQGVGDFVAHQTFLSTEWAGALVMVGLIAGVYIGVILVMRLLERLAQLTFHAKVNQVGGLLVGLVRGGLVASVILVALRQLPSSYLAASIEERSLTGPIVSRMAPAVYDTVTPWVGRALSGFRSS